QRKKPVIAAVDGLATAGGCELVLACDMVVATTRSAFGWQRSDTQPNCRCRWTLPLAPSHWSRRRNGGDSHWRAVYGQRAYELGMVNHLVEPEKVLEGAMDLALRVCKAAPLAVWSSRKIVLAAATESDETLIKMTNKELVKY
ncbi:probable enoyl-CoA hydratase, mitochondrial, partial [Acidimicrobiaceae bacterium]